MSDPSSNALGPAGIETRPSASANGTSEKWSGRLRATVAILCGALFLDAMDVSSVNVALPTIGSHLHMSASTLQWVVSGYVLGYGGFLLLGGRAPGPLRPPPGFPSPPPLFGPSSGPAAAAAHPTLPLSPRRPTAAP